MREPRARGSAGAALHHESGGHLDPVRRAPHSETFFRQLTEQGADFLSTVKANQRTLHRQISEQFLYSRKIPFTATVSEHGHGRDTTWSLGAKQAPDFITEAWPGSSWIVELVVSGKRAGKPSLQRHLFLTSLRTTPKALLQLVRDSWCIESWHRLRDTQLHEDDHRYGGPGAAVLATLRTLALNLLRLHAHQLVRAGLAAVAHDIAKLLAMAGIRPGWAT
ncbi:MAG: ISAs1 family transposase [Synechococcaceae cyanobacterium]